MGSAVPACLAVHPDGTQLRIRLQPRARRTAVVGMVGERLKVAVCGPPVDGKANRDLCQFLADQLDAPKSAVVILHGETSREKTVVVRGLTPSTVAALLKL